MPLGSQKVGFLAASAGGASQYFGDGSLGNCQFGASAITQTSDSVAIDTVLTTGSESGGPGSNSYGSQVDNSSACYETTVLNKVDSFDGDMWVGNFKDLTIDASVTLTTDRPCRGMLVYVDGDCSIAGVLSMTSRGGKADPTSSGGSDSSAVSSTGIRLPMLTASGSSTLAAADFAGCGDAAVAAVENQVEAAGDGTIFVISRIGAAGGPGGSASGGGVSSPGTDGVDGAGSATTIESGGGGGGGARAAEPPPVTGGTGAVGTCFSGGAGGGGAAGSIGLTAGSGGAYGGAGGSEAHGGGGYGSSYGGGGAGNPGAPSGPTIAGQSGIGGLLFLIVSGDLTISGKLDSTGTTGGFGYDSNTGRYGGASGGGNIMVLYAGSYSLTGEISVAGGIPYSGGGGSAGDGGDGQSHVAQVSSA